MFFHHEEHEVNEGPMPLPHFLWIVPDLTGYCILRGH